MADRLDYFFRQKVTEAELDEGFDKQEAADQKIMTDQLLTGIFVGGAVAEHFPTPDLTVDIAGPFNAYDQSGQRVFFSALQVLDMALDENGVSTAVASGGNEKTLAIFIEFDRALSDPRLDGNSVTVFFQRAESFKLNVVQSAEAGIGNSIAPGLRVDQLLLADVVIINAQTQIFDGDIDSSRREDVFDLTGSPNAIKTGRVKTALQSMLDILNAGATGVSYGGGNNWLDGTTNPATTVELQLDKIIDDLVAAAGADRIGANTGPSWKDTTAVAAGSIEDRLDQIITDLVADAGDDRIGVLATAGGIVTAGGSIHDALEELEVVIQSGNDGVYPILILAGEELGAWVKTTVFGASDYPAYEQTGVSANILAIPLPSLGNVGTITQVSIQIQSATTDDIRIELFLYDPASGQTRSSISSSSAGSGLGGNVAINITGLSLPVSPGSNRSRWVEIITEGAGGGTRIITGGSVTLG